MPHTASAKGVDAIVIGGGIAGVMAMGGLILMKTRPNMKQKLLISLGSSAVIVVIGVALILYAMYVATQMQA
jgi:hypothetical protein